MRIKPKLCENLQVSKACQFNAISWIFKGLFKVCSVNSERNHEREGAVAAQELLGLNNMDGIQQRGTQQDRVYSDDEINEVTRTLLIKKQRSFYETGICN